MNPPSKPIHYSVHSVRTFMIEISRFLVTIILAAGKLIKLPDPCTELQISYRLQSFASPQGFQQAHRSRHHVVT